MTSQHGAYALHAGKARLHAHTRMHKPTRPGTHTHACMHEHARIAFPRQQQFAKAPQCYIMRTLPILFFFFVFPLYSLPITSPDGRTVFVKQPRNRNHIASPQSATPHHPNAHRRSL
jgi:hypothetical protein